MVVSSSYPNFLSHLRNTHISLIGGSELSVWVNGACVLRWTDVTPDRTSTEDEWMTEELV